jgi:hypothetical protein
MLLMFRAILASTLLLFASGALAQDIQRATSPLALGSGDSRSPLRQGAITVIYGAGALDAGGMVALSIGSGRENDCGSQRWTMPSANVISIDKAGECRVDGHLVTQYRITYRVP